VERTQHDPRVAPHISYNRFGPYEIESVLGQGAVAVVYAAKDGTGKPLVLKVLTRPAAAQAPIRLGFQREYRTLSKLRHRNIVQVFGTGEVDGYFYIAMERIIGETLDGFLLRSKKLGESAAIGIARQVAGALDYLHSRGYVHRDIKPGNLLLAQDGRIVLFDFGTVLDLEDPDPEQTVGVYGTPAFLAPEQIRDATAIDGRADLYALGILLYLMVTGRKPFYGGRNEVLEAHLKTAPPPPSDFAHVSPDLERVILKSLAKDPADRFQTGAEFIAALDGTELTPKPEQPIAGRLRRLFGA
jgi:serine/threonine protein kinase